MSVEIAASDLSARVNEFEISDAPESFTDDSVEYGCVVCGVDVSHLYKRRVKEPRCEEHKKTPGAKTGTSTGKRGSKDVEAAVSSLNQVYTLLQMGLGLLGANLANDTMSASLPSLEKSNREHLTNDPELAKRIADMGKTGGRYAFFSAQVLTIGPVLFLAYSELAQRRTEKKDQTEQGWTVPVDVPATNVSGFPV